MTTPVTEGLGGLSNLVSQKWFAAIGMIGLLMFVTALMFDTRADPVVAQSVGLIMMGFGFCQTECRTFQQHIVRNGIITAPVWHWTFTGALMAIIAVGGTIWLTSYLIF